MLEMIWNRSKKRKREIKNDLIPQGIANTVIPSVFIDGNKNPIWDNNYKLFHKSKKENI